MNNPIKSQIAANRERFDERYQISDDTYSFDTVNEVFKADADELKNFLTTSQTSLLQTAIAAVEEMEKMESDYDDEDKRSRRDVRPFNEALSKVVELLKGGIDN